MEKDSHLHKDKTPGNAPLPRWDLRDLFPGPDSPELKAALEDLAKQTKLFAENYKDRVEKLTGPQLGQAIERFEKISELAARIEAYAELSRAADAGKSGFAASLDEKTRAALGPVLFFTLDLCRIDEPALLEKMAAPQAARYAPWLAGLRAQKDHQLGMAAEQHIQNMAPVTEEAWQRLYDQTLLDLRFTLRGKEMTEAEIVNLIDTTHDAKLRRAAFAEYGRVLGEKKGVFSLIVNTLADLHALDDRWRKFDSPEHFRHVENRIEPETVTALTDTVRAHYKSTSHRYYAWKAKQFGHARLHAAERNAPLPGAKPRRYSWEEAKEIVLAAFAKLSPEMEKTGRRFFDEGWIDAQPRAGKDGGGFSHPATTDTHPYILVNFFGTAADVQTLAHELGHGIHQVLAAEQGYLNSDTPLTLAETASVFGEMLTFRALLDAESDPVTRRNMLAGKVEDMLNTVTRQTAFFTFEQKLHEERRTKGELSPERLGVLWLETQRESLGPSVNLDVAGAENLWAAVPHFIHTPFYVYAYAFGDCLVGALYDTYEKSADKKDFAKKYTDLLKAGGTKRHEDALAPFGLDTGDKDFWKKGMAVITRYIDEIEALDRQIALEKGIGENKADITGKKTAAKHAPANDDVKKDAKKKHAPKGPGA
ncbi:MAG: M3 family oligoendopeptidase [Alphaproteobacteria bacterium]|nr:M3 family oligoendopeptidase [Alphaproteobacteria bacterium]